MFLLVHGYVCEGIFWMGKEVGRRWSGRWRSRGAGSRWLFVELIGVRVWREKERWLALVVRQELVLPSKEE